jgi:hypothetical protein
VTSDNTAVALDGNAAASFLLEFFGRDLTTAQMQCGACKYFGAVASSRLYGASMGVILRCANCDGILMRAAHTPHNYWLEMTGAQCLKF